MRTASSILLVTSIWGACCLFLAPVIQGSVPPVGVLEREILSSRYSGTAATLLLQDQFSPSPAGASSAAGTKSPAVAFALSLAVPGAGQWYGGSRGVKPFLFLGIDVAAWVLHFKYQGDGDDRTRVYELYRQAHWRPEDYEAYLQLAYNTTNDDSLKATGTRGFTHSLPSDTNDQQYYEQVGKYNQFAWGWDDAVLSVNGSDYVLATLNQLNPVPLIGDAVPRSSNRTTYETLRNDANKTYDKATNMIYVSLGNRLISAFEAMLSARARNKRLKGGGDGTLSSVTISPRFRSIHSFGDTPYVTVRVAW